MAQLIGQGPVAAPGPTSQVWNMTSPGAPMKKGARARDVDGNEYIFVDATGTIAAKTLVVIGSDYTGANPAVLTGKGPIGVAAASATSDQGLWVQVYGRCLVQVGTSDCSPSDAANGPTTDSSTGQTLFFTASSESTPAGRARNVSDASTDGFRIHGMFVASDASVGDVSATTSAACGLLHGGNEIAVFLNYPYLQYVTVSPS